MDRKGFSRKNQMIIFKHQEVSAHWLNDHMWVIHEALSVRAPAGDAFRRTLTDCIWGPSSAKPRYQIHEGLTEKHFCILKVPTTKLGERCSSIRRRLRASRSEVTHQHTDTPPCTVQQAAMFVHERHCHLVKSVFIYSFFSSHKRSIALQR